MDLKRIVTYGGGYPFAVVATCVAVAMLVPFRAVLATPVFMLLLVPRHHPHRPRLRGPRRRRPQPSSRFCCSTSCSSRRTTGLPSLRLPSGSVWWSFSSSRWSRGSRLPSCAGVSRRHSGGSESWSCSTGSRSASPPRSPPHATAELIVSQVAEVLGARRAALYAAQRGRRRARTMSRLGRASRRRPRARSRSGRVGAAEPARPSACRASARTPWDRRLVSVGADEAIPGVVAEGLYLPLRTSTSLEGVLVAGADADALSPAMTMPACSRR